MRNAAPTLLDLSLSLSVFSTEPDGALKSEKENEVRARDEKRKDMVG